MSVTGDSSTSKKMRGLQILRAFPYSAGDEHPSWLQTDGSSNQRGV